MNYCHAFRFSYPFKSLEKMLITPLSHGSMHHLVIMKVKQEKKNIALLD